MQGKTAGWGLLVVGVLGALGAYAYDYGTMWVVILIIVALVGAWLTFFNNESDQSTPPSESPPMQ